MGLVQVGGGAVDSVVGGLNVVVVVVVVVAGEFLICTPTMMERAES